MVYDDEIYQNWRKEGRNGCDLGPLGYGLSLVLGCDRQAPGSLVPLDSGPPNPGLESALHRHEPDLLGLQLPG